MTRWLARLLFTMTLLALACAPLSAAPASAPASAPATRAAGPVAFQPGVSIDWSAKQVLVEGEVVLREGDLELFACSPDSKEHESIVGVHARPTHIFQALGLVGLEPGSPPSYDNDQKEMIPAKGQRLDITVRWTEEGQPRAVPIHHWLYDKTNKQPAGPVDWVFAGSTPTVDDRLLADLDGTVICVVDFPGPIITQAASHTSDNASLWLAAYTDRIPPKGTPVTLVIQAARPSLALRLDRFGRLRLGNRQASLRQVIQAAREAGPTAKATLEHDPSLSDIQLRQLTLALTQAGLAEVTLVAAPEAPKSALSGSPRPSEIGAGQGASGDSPRSQIEEQGKALLDTFSALSRQLPEAIDLMASSLQDSYRRLNDRALAARQAAAGAARAFSNPPATLPND